MLRAGAVAVPLNAMLDVPEMREQLAHVGAVAAIAGDVDAEVREGLARLAAARAPEPGHAARCRSRVPGDPACIFLTSGSTGRPKGVVHTQGSLLHMALQLASTLPFGPEERSIAFLPFFAAAEQVLPVLCTGGSLDVLPGFDPERIAAAARHATSLRRRADGDGAAARPGAARGPGPPALGVVRLRADAGEPAAALVGRAARRRDATSSTG